MRPLVRTAVPVLFVAAAVAASGCSARYIRTAPRHPSRLRPADSLTRNVVVVSIDGLRPDAIAEYGASTLQRLMREGSYTLSASTIHPSKTLPSHTSMLTGQPPERHGVLWNNVATAQTDSVDLPNIFSVARSHGYSTAAFFSKAKFQPLQLEGTLDYSQAPGGLYGRWSSERTLSDVSTVPGTRASQRAVRPSHRSRRRGPPLRVDDPRVRPRRPRGGSRRGPADRAGGARLRSGQLLGDRHRGSRRPWHEPRQRRSARCHDSVDCLGEGREAGRPAGDHHPHHGHGRDGALAARGDRTGRLGRPAGARRLHGRRRGGRQSSRWVPRPAADRHPRLTAASACCAVNCWDSSRL